MTDSSSLDPVFVNIPCPTETEAKKLCKELLEKDLCGTAKIHNNVHLMYSENDTVHGSDVVLMTLKTTKAKLNDIQAYILSNHSWGSPCIEVISIANDMC